MSRIVIDPLLTLVRVAASGWLLDCAACAGKSSFSGEIVIAFGRGGATSVLAGRADEIVSNIKHAARRLFTYIPTLF